MFPDEIPAPRDEAQPADSDHTPVASAHSARPAHLAVPTLWARSLTQLADWFRHPSTVEERNVRNVLADSVGVGLATGVGSFLSVFLIRLGATDFMVGLLTAMPALTGMFLSIPVGRFLSRQRQIVPWFSYSRFFVLSCYALTGLVPFFLTRYRAEAILAIWAVATLPQTLVSVAFTVVMGAVAGPRGRFFLMSRRWSLLGFTNAVTALIVGQVLEMIAFPLNYQVVFLGATIGGLISVYFSSHITLPDQELPPSTSRDQPLHSRLRERLSEVAGNQTFTHFLVSQFIFRWGLMLPVPLIPIYWVRQLQASDGWIGILNTVQSVVLLGAYFLWSRLSRRHGERFVLLASTLGISLYPALTAVMPRVEPLVPLVALAGIFRAGMDLVFFDLALATCPERESPYYIGIYQTTAFICSFLAPLLGTTLSASIGIELALVIGTALGLVGWLLMVLLHVGQDDPKATPVR
ncbi:MAG: MFS transporter [Anaerolineae bacterium]|nr:MFS transporter [Anaerolineae bacterium]MDW8100001.1 MFS transporter [Anaerolineae bacterium]